MDSFTAVMTILAGIGTVLSITFAILAFARNKRKDTSDIASRLTKIETDILYIREKFDERREWEKEIELRLRKLETK